ncbi:hypothetical protein [Peribacillus simplex]|uniref:hypothetical protein n=1 Tax=Peribacillus simplex TaxID=1478 RepID=UPI003D2C2E0C
MSEPRFKMKKIWTDVDFFEVNLELIGNDCRVNIDIYLDNGHLEELQQGIINFADHLGRNEFIWITGHEIENTTHFLSMRFFQLEKTGTVGIEVKLDNKMEQPYSMRSNFYLLTEINQIDDLARKLVRFIENETIEIESLF